MTRTKKKSGYEKSLEIFWRGNAGNFDRFDSSNDLVRFVDYGYPT